MMVLYSAGKGFLVRPRGVFKKVAHGVVADMHEARLEGFTWHGFRQTYNNTWLAQGGVSVEIRPRPCGWSSRQIVNGYTHYNVGHLRPYSTIIDHVLRGTT